MGAPPSTIGLVLGTVLAVTAVAGGVMFGTSYRRAVQLEQDAGEHLAAAAAFLRAADYTAAGGELANARGHLEAVQYDVGPLAEKANALGEELAAALHAAEVDTRVAALIDESQRLSGGRSPNYAKAVELLSEAITYRPHDARLLLYRGSALCDLGRYASALGDLEQSLQCVGGDLPTTHLLLATAAQQVGEGEKAQVHRELGKQQGPDTVESLVAEALATPHSERGVELLTQAIAMSPFDPILYYHRGRIAYNLTVRKTARRHYDMAVADLEKALLGRPRDTRISEALCLTLVQFTELFDVSWKKNSEREKQLLDEWLATEPDNVSALAILADWQSRYSTLEAVLATCDKGHKLDRARPEFLLFAGHAYHLHGQSRQAIEYFTKAIELQPEPYTHTYSMGRVDLRAWRALAHYWLGENDVARKELQLASSLGVKEEWTFFDWDGLIRVYCNVGDSQEALRWSDERAKITPDCPQVYELRGQIYRGLDRLEEALADYDKAVELNPQSAIPRVFRGDFYSQRSEWTKALADYDKALELEPSFASLWLQRGDFYSQRGEWPKAIADYEKAHQLETLRTQDINGMAWLLTNCPDRSVWNPDRAIEYATKAVAMAPNEGAFWNTLGAAQYRAGQCKEAVTTLSKSMELRSGGDRLGLVLPGHGPQATGEPGRGPAVVRQGRRVDADEQTRRRRTAPVPRRSGRPARRDTARCRASTRACGESRGGAGIAEVHARTGGGERRGATEVT